MIRAVNRGDLPDCLRVFHEGYETVAVRFGLTDQNCPDRGRANLPFEKLVADFERGVAMFCCERDGQIVGFLGMSVENNGCKLHDIIVLPRYRQMGYGSSLLRFCKEWAKERGANVIRLGLIDENTPLKRWYEANGFACTGTRQYEGAPFTVSYMECAL